mmetsp:Transcript_33606/g.72521  ORF Transcript_33606/g.72521 Transcript_33606/m.72521 type:complete len:158 (-) Transcript_33606:43-516(-)
MGSSPFVGIGTRRQQAAAWIISFQLHQLLHSRHLCVHCRQADSLKMGSAQATLPVLLAEDPQVCLEVQRMRYGDPSCEHPFLLHPHQQVPADDGKKKGGPPVIWLPLCPECRGAVPQNASKCRHCGTYQGTTAVKCPGCLERVPAAAKKCKWCQTDL